MSMQCDDMPIWMEVYQPTIKVATDMETLAVKSIRVLSLHIQVFICTRLICSP